MLYMLTAGKKALADGGITEDVIKELDKAKCGVLIGSALGGMKVNVNLFIYFCIMDACCCYISNLTALSFE